MLLRDLSPWACRFTKLLFAFTNDWWYTAYLLHQPTDQSVIDILWYSSPNHDGICNHLLYFHIWQAINFWPYLNTFCPLVHAYIYIENWALKQHYIQVYFICWCLFSVSIHYFMYVFSFFFEFPQGDSFTFMVAYHIVNAPFQEVQLPTKKGEKVSSSNLSTPHLLSFSSHCAWKVHR